MEFKLNKEYKKYLITNPLIIIFKLNNKLVFTNLVTNNLFYNYNNTFIYSLIFLIYKDLINLIIINLVYS